MFKLLPARPNLQYYHKQAKGLLKAFQEADAAVIKRLKDTLPEWKNASTKAIQAGHISLKDMLRLLAFEHGYKTWPDMKIEIVNRQITSLPLFTSLHFDDIESKKDEIMRHAGKASINWSEKLQDTEIVYPYLRINKAGAIESITWHASKSKVKDIEIEPNKAISSWRFPGVKADEYYLGRLLTLHSRLTSHKNTKVRRLAKEHFDDLKLGKATNMKLDQLRQAILFYQGRQPL